MNSSPILLFDGICNFCNRWVNFIIRHDKKKKFRFAPLQSEAAKKLLTPFPEHEKTDSFILLENRKAYYKSTAALKIVKHLGGFFSFLYLFIVIPRFVRDYAYDLIARNRYSWWGKRDACMVPSADVKDRFYPLPGKENGDNAQ